MREYSSPRLWLYRLSRVTRHIMALSVFSNRRLFRRSNMLQYQLISPSPFISVHRIKRVSSLFSITIYLGLIYQRESPHISITNYFGSKYQHDLVPYLYSYVSRFSISEADYSLSDIFNYAVTFNIKISCYFGSQRCVIHQVSRFAKGGI